MAASVAWSDTVGSGTISPHGGGPTGAWQRFKNWEPFTKPFGDAAHGLGTGVRYLFAFRTDYGASFEINGIPNDQLDLALRLQAHLLGGGSVAVYTGDVNSATYGTCGLAPETEPELSLSDAQVLEYTLRLTLINIAGSPVPMLCEY